MKPMSVGRLVVVHILFVLSLDVLSACLLFLHLINEYWNLHKDRFALLDNYFRVERAVAGFLSCWTFGDRQGLD